MLLRLVLIAFLIFLIYWVIKFFSFLHKINLLFKSKEQSFQPKKSNLMVKDEVCNTYLPKDEAIEVNIEGKNIIFVHLSVNKNF